jgi:hypothetical protein
MSKVLIHKRKGPFDLKPLAGSNKPVKWAPNTPKKFDDEEAAQLLNYKDVLELKQGEAVAKKEDGPAPAPAGSGLAGKLSADTQNVGPKK